MVRRPCLGGLVECQSSWCRYEAGNVIYVLSSEHPSIRALCSYIVGFRKPETPLTIIVFRRTWIEMEISSIQVPIAQQLIFRIGPAFVLMIAVVRLIIALLFSFAILLSLDMWLYWSSAVQSLSVFEYTISLTLLSSGLSLHDLNHVHWMCWLQIRLLWSWYQEQYIICTFIH